MCECCLKTEIIELDEQPLFTVNYCGIHDVYFDGFGYPLEMKQREVIEQ
jgi:hypothetical protein